MNIDYDIWVFLKSNNDEEHRVLASRVGIFGKRKRFCIHRNTMFGKVTVTSDQLDR